MSDEDKLRKDKAPILLPKQQAEKRRKARRTTDHKRVKIWGAEVSCKVDPGKIKEFKQEGGLITAILQCPLCESTNVESKTVAKGEVETFKERALGSIAKPGGIGGTEYRNKILKFERGCFDCGFITQGSVNIAILGETIDKEKEKRYADKINETFGSVLRIKAAITNGNFPPSLYYLAPFSEEEKPVPMALRYWCGSCGEVGFPREASRLFADICKQVDKMFLGEENSYNESFDFDFRCRRCSNQMRIKGTLKVEIPTERGAAIETFKQWQEDAYSLTLQKGKIQTLVDWDELARAYASKEAESEK